MGGKTKVAIVKPSEYENIDVAVSDALMLIHAEDILKLERAENSFLGIKNSNSEDFLQSLLIDDFLRVHQG